ncbi:hypothetical protein AAMO2058_000941200 [Amorphochlora amoebiformis]|mmetsp:Transcript_5942/g.9137  ORF Transcript_5942/g.9137 Transcript_5942/m.9137 type:complete len:380 (-) Transcript_5942:167-1306(-)
MVMPRAAILSAYLLAFDAYWHFVIGNNGDGSKESSFTPMDQVTHSTLGTLEKESPLCRDLAEIAKRVKRGSFDDVTLSSPSDTPLHFSRNLSLLVNRETFINNTGIMLPSYLNSSLDSHKSDPHTITTEEARELEQEMEISDSDRLNDTNMVFHGPDHKDCRSLKLKLFYDKIFRDLDFRPFTIKFPLNIFFEGIKITPGMEINSLESNYKPEVRYRGEDRLYFFLMVDMDDPIPEDPFNRESVLWARYNIPGECFWMGKDVVPWTGHVNAMGKHRILAFLYEQKQSMYIPAFPMQQVKQKDLTYWLDLNPVSVAYYKNEGTELSERDLGMHIKDGPLSSTDSNSYIDKLKKTSKEVIKNLTRYHIRADAAARGLLPPV